MPEPVGSQTQFVVKPLPKKERQRIERTVRHAQSTRWPVGTDSWIRGYGEDVPKLLAEIDRLKLGFSRELYARRAR